MPQKERRDFFSLIPSSPFIGLYNWIAKSAFSVFLKYTLFHISLMKF